MCGQSQPPPNCILTCGAVLRICSSGATRQDGSQRSHQQCCDPDAAAGHHSAAPCVRKAVRKAAIWDLEQGWAGWLWRMCLAPSRREFA